MSSVAEKQDEKGYWRSLAERADDPEFKKNLEREFPHMEFGEPGSLERRRFMQVMGASLAFAGMAACRWEKEIISPFSKNPEGYIPGIPKRFGTAMELGGFAEGLLVTSYDGRPVKVEGHPDHPISHGATSRYAQAAILELYDPDRSQKVVQRNGGQVAARRWDDVAAALRGWAQGYQEKKGRGLRILSEATSSPTILATRDRLLAMYPEAKWVEYEPVSGDNVRVGATLALGAPYRSYYDFSQADVVLALDSDVLECTPASLRYAYDFVQKRKPESGSMARLYAVESRYTATGAMADHRLPVRAEQVAAFVLALAAELLDSGKLPVPSTLAKMQRLPKQGFLADEGVASFVRAVARDLLAHPGRSIVSVGDGQAPEVHALVHHINALLQNQGKTVRYVADHNPARVPHWEAIRDLTTEMANGAVDGLLILGGNPVYNVPGELHFKEALAKVADTLHVSLYEDETSQACQWHVPRAHFLESWGDARSFDGTVSIVQPLIQPLYHDAKSPLEVLLVLLGDATAARDMVRKSLVALIPGLSSDTTWRKSLHNGFVAGSTPAFASPVLVPFAPFALSPHALSDGKSRDNTVEVTYWYDSSVYDGRFANNAWLQELPDFLTKLTWDTAALVSPRTAEELGLKHESLISIKRGAQEITVPVYVMPGQAPYSIALFVGYGRTSAGVVGGSDLMDVKPVGHDVYPLLPVSGTNIIVDARVTAKGGKYVLACTQDHYAIDKVGQMGTQERLGELVREATLDEFKHHPDFAQHKVHHPPLLSLWKEKTYDEGHRWGMSIDLNSCTGCSACVVACQSENNVPVVGKAQVLKSREMHWIRIDRYFAGDPNAPRVAHQPLTCHQCENAPCESVCPVGATMHTEEGLNDMVYNRCIGTRYCGNNCPYKVRRFNYFNFNKKIDNDPRHEVEKLKFNPEVTVRHRGVMEKCTYCVQRIRFATNQARIQHRPLQDGEIVPACAQACPTKAITFGDLNDAKSQVTEQMNRPRSYAMLAELNVKPRTRYLAKVRNPNPELDVK